MSEVENNLFVVKQAIADAARASGRSPEEIHLVAVSKTHPAEAVRKALEAGQLVFGESRVQEARAKIPLLPPQARWHFIGHLQTNKIRQALPLFELFHGIDSLGLAREINRIATDLGLFPRILLEVNVAGEASKFGFTPETLLAQFDEILQFPRLQVEGLMTIPPPAPDPDRNRPYFAALRTLRDRLQEQWRVTLPQLSMGMSDDFPAAITEGATFVRVGTSIFGSR